LLTQDITSKVEHFSLKVSGDGSVDWLKQKLIGNNLCRKPSEIRWKSVVFNIKGKINKFYWSCQS
jgi:hypothetical protein